MHWVDNDSSGCLKWFAGVLMLGTLLATFLLFNLLRMAIIVEVNRPQLLAKYERLSSPEEVPRQDDDLVVHRKEDVPKKAFSLTAYYLRFLYVIVGGIVLMYLWSVRPTKARLLPGDVDLDKIVYYVETKRRRRWLRRRKK